MATVFSQIISGQIPGRFVWADDAVVAFATIAPITPGHMLVVPRLEIDQFTDASDRLLTDLMQVAKHVGNAQKAAFNAPRAALLVAGFEVPHLHVHVLPSWSEEQLTFANANANARPEELDDATDRVRAALREAGHSEYVPGRGPLHSSGRAR